MISNMETKRINPVVTQSKQWLLNALLLLMKEKKYTKITIKELTKRADLDRKTFYRHFKSKDDIVDMFIGVVFDKYVTSMNKLQNVTFRDSVREYFELLLQCIDVLMLFNKHGLLIHIQKGFIKYVHLQGSVFFSGPDYRDVTVWESSFRACGVWGVTELWLSTGAKETPEELSEIVDSICTPLHR